tara:strand:- start:329 stop:967 length:639 start_codon:yes stop_codon:yes gene_type:complete
VDKIKEIEETLSRSVCGGWDRGFLESILEQLSKARPLSLKQKQTLGKVLGRNTPESQQKHENWTAIYKTDHTRTATILASYHLRQPYYKAMAQDILAGKIPERGKFLRMRDNKYSKKVLAQYDAVPKYEVGSYLCPRTAFDHYRHAEFKVDMVWSTQNKIIQNFIKRGAFVMEICSEIHSAAKGAKRYKLLPIGETMPIIVEERFLKKASPQ